MLRIWRAMILPMAFNANIAFAACNGFWELNTLARSNNNHILISENKRTYSLSSDRLKKLAEIKEKIDSSAGIYTRLLICNSDEANAFAWKSADQNMTGLTLGMVNLLKDDYAAYAALLGHENAHLVQNHGQQKSERAIGLGLLQLLAGIALEVTIQQSAGIRGLGSDLASLGNQALSASYSRDSEREADRLGTRYAFKAGFDPDGALRLHRYLSSNANFFSTHPSSDSRIQTINEEIQALKSAQNATRASPIAAERLKNEGAGQIVLLNSRLGYYVATQVELETPLPGMRVGVKHGDYEFWGTIHRVVDGYFSVIPDGAIEQYSVGNRVFYK